jgi:hypothetical protein
VSCRIESFDAWRAAPRAWPLTGDPAGCFLNTGSKDAGSVDAKTFLMHGFRKDESN